MGTGERSIASLDCTRLDEDIPVDDRNLLTGRVAALWSLDSHQVLKLIWGTAAQDKHQIQFTEPERIRTLELAYIYNFTRFIDRQHHGDQGAGR